jgi:nitrogen fixation NifU-like protein
LKQGEISVDDFYKENILDHYRHPRNAGTLDNATHTHEEDNPLCGDVIKIQMQVNEQGIIEQVAFSGRGCAISQASASMLMEMIEGKSLDEAKQIGKEEILEVLGIQIGPTRMKCALLSLKVLKAGAYGLSEEDWNTDDEW